jgi:cellulose synthase/poly-beta-1,6-N-acetylglucosamine synthase-like glycosyltransferase
LGRIPVSINDPDLPTVTALIPLYKEAEMLPTIVASMEALQYPKDHFQALLLLEEDDTDTRFVAERMELPDYFEIVVIPDQKPKGKPKALNVGLARATGVLCVIFDAEDHPAPDQVLKAVAGFRESPEEVACVQAPLEFTNQGTNWRTRFYWTEYIVHFSRVLPGLAKLDLIPPLGGTSNYFQTSVLRRIAFDSEHLPKGAIGIPAWDAWNVTEDAELAGALYARGYRVRVIDSVTEEAAASGAINAYKQRKRWLKGYLQTALVYTRHPVEMIRQMGFVRWFVYILMMVGTPSSLLFNPLTWGLTIAYFVTRATYMPTAVFIQGLFPAPLFYTGVLLMLVGNAFLFFQLVGACFEREGYSTLKYLLLAPLWWAFTSLSAYGVLWELARPSTRHAWNKTDHRKELLQQEQSQKVKKTGVDSDLEQILDIV